MKKVQDKPNSVAPGGDYQYGTMQDDPGGGTGSKADTEFMTDYVQFFERLMDKSGIAASGLPDNDANGYDLYEAFRKLTRPYKVYTALMTQVDVVPPTAAVQGLNDVGVIVWTYLGVGTYRGTLAGAFVNAKTWFSLPPGQEGLEGFKVVRVSANTIDLTSFLAGAGTDGLLNETSLEVRVYD